MAYMPVAASTSHSWLWFVDMFRPNGLLMPSRSGCPCSALRAASTNGRFGGSGGDTVAIAEALGEEGARQLEAFIKAGGVYLGSSAPELTW